MDWSSFAIGFAAGLAIFTLAFAVWAMLIVSKRADEQADRWRKRRAFYEELSTDEWLDSGGHVTVNRPDENKEEQQ